MTCSLVCLFAKGQRASWLLVDCETGGVSRGSEKMWLRWFADSFRGVLCRTLLLVPAFPNWQLEFFYILLSIICPNCASTQLF